MMRNVSRAVFMGGGGTGPAEAGTTNAEADRLKPGLRTYDGRSCSSSGLMPRLRSRTVRSSLFCQISLRSRSSSPAMYSQRRWMHSMVVTLVGDAMV